MYDKIWTTEQQRIVQHYITGATSERNSTYMRLYPTVNEYIDLITKQLKKKSTDDLKQHIHLKLYDYTLNQLTIERKDTAKDLIYISIRNLVIDYNRRYNDVMQPTEEIENYELKQEPRYTEIEAQERLYNNEKILQAIDNKIKEFSKKTRTNSLVLMLLLIKQYLVDNNFDERECGQYLMKTLNLRRKTVVTMFGKVGIRSFVFFKPKLNDK